MNKPLLALILICTIHLGHGVSPKKICHLNESKKCIQMPFTYKCGREHCVHQKEDCDEYLLLVKLYNSRLLGTIREMGMLSQDAHTVITNNRDRFKAFESQIEQCPRRMPTAEWTSKDVCLKRKKCFKQISTSLLLTSYVKVDCPCYGEHIYDCGRDYCAVDESLCVAINQTGVESSLLGSAKKCSFWDF